MSTARGEGGGRGEDEIPALKLFLPLYDCCQWQHVLNMMKPIGSYHHGNRFLPIEAFEGSKSSLLSTGTMATKCVTLDTMQSRCEKDPTYTKSWVSQANKV